MKYTTLLSVIIAMLMLCACDDKEKLPFRVSSNEANFVVGIEEIRIKVTTDSDHWQLRTTGDWLEVKHEGDELVIIAETNQTRETRNARVLLVIGQDYADIAVTQEAGILAVGDPYPNAANPIGIIYKLTDGGLHGKVISLNDTAIVKWSYNDRVFEGARDMHDGKVNTRYMIEQCMDKNDFEEMCTPFWWVHTQKNNGDINGPWYIPSYYELEELYYILTGNKYRLPAIAPIFVPVLVYDYAVQNRFNELLTQYGGMPVSYNELGENSIHISSNEYAINQVRSIPFLTRPGSVVTYAKSKSFVYVPAANLVGPRCRPILTF